jgi:hypothetical protein
MARTEDGEWWLVAEGDDSSDIVETFTLPIGTECLKKSKEFSRYIKESS